MSFKSVCAIDQLAVFLEMKDSQRFLGNHLKCFDLVMGMQMMFVML